MKCSLFQTEWLWFDPSMSPNVKCKELWSRRHRTLPDTLHNSPGNQGPLSPNCSIPYQTPTAWPDGLFRLGRPYPLYLKTPILVVLRYRRINSNQWEFYTRILCYYLHVNITKLLTATAEATQRRKAAPIWRREYLTSNKYRIFPTYRRMGLYANLCVFGGR